MKMQTDLTSMKTGHRVSETIRNGVRRRRRNGTERIFSSFPPPPPRPFGSKRRPKYIARADLYERIKKYNFFFFFFFFLAQQREVEIARQPLFWWRVGERERRAAQTTGQSEPRSPIDAVPNKIRGGRENHARRRRRAGPHTRKNKKSILGDVVQQRWR